MTLYEEMTRLWVSLRKRDKKCDEIREIFSQCVRLIEMVQTALEDADPSINESI